MADEHLLDFAEFLRGVSRLAVEDGRSHVGARWKSAVVPNGNKFTDVAMPLWSDQGFDFSRWHSDMCTGHVGRAAFENVAQVAESLAYDNTDGPS